MRVGFGAVHWLMEPELNGLSMDVTAVPVFYGGSLIAQSDEVVVTVGRDEYGSEDKIGLNTAPSPHALIVGPTGSGKSWSTVSLLMRAMNYGVGVLVIDPQGEYPSYLKAHNPTVINILDAFIDVFKPIINKEAWADIVSQAVGYAYNDPGLANMVFEDLIELYNAYEEYPGLHEALDWLVRNGKAKRVWYVARALAPEKTFELSQLMSAPNPVIIILRDVMVHKNYVTLIMQLFLARAYYEGLTKPFTEKIKNIIALDEAYLIIGSPVLEIVVRGVRKMGFGVWIITQDLGDVDSKVLQNFGFSLLLQGPAPHAESVGKVFRLGEDNVTWLSQANNPRIFGGEYTPGILIYPPRPRRVFVKLEPVKG